MDQDKDNQNQPDETDLKPEDSANSYDAPETQLSEPPTSVQEFTPTSPEPINPVNTSSPSTPTNHPNSPGIIVIQWLTYAFWGWTILAMSFLTTLVLANYIKGINDGSFAPYAVAAVIVLLPISFITDFFYSKHEPDKKTGGATIVMVIHAVLYALFGIAALIVIVFSLVNLFTTSSSDNSAIEITLITAVIVMVLYGAVFLRVLTPRKPKWLHKAFMIFMVVTVGIIAVLGIVGPTLSARQSRNDLLIQNNLSNISTAINSYATNNSSLPSSLSQLTLSGDSQKLVTDNLVDYTPNTLRATPTVSYSNSTAVTGTSSYTYYYQLCVNYVKPSGIGNNSTNNNGNGLNGYSTDVDTYDHGSGRTCYKLETSSY